jgi:hypothetical protein
MRKLRIGSPQFDGYPSITDVQLPRISPELQALPPAAESPLYATVGTDSRNWTLGKGWNNLESLTLAGLGQNGVNRYLT